MNNWHYYNIHNLLKVKTNFIGYLPDSFLSKRPLKNPDIIFSLQKKLDFSKKNSYFQIAPGLFYNPKDDSVFSHIRMLGFEISWRLKNLSSKTTKVFFNKAYKNLVKIPIATVHPINDYLKFILQIKLITEGYSFILGGAFKPVSSNFAIIISSCGGMGKTTTVLELVKKIKGSFLSDDTVIVSRKKVYPYPAKINIRQFGSPILSFNKSTPVEKVFAQKKIFLQAVPTKYIFFLEKSKENKIKTITASNALKKILAINRKTLPYQSERSILAYLYQNPSFNINAIVGKEEKILSSFLKNVKALQLRATKASYYPKLIADFLNE